MSEENKAAVRRAYQAMGAGDFAALDQLIADDVVEHERLPGLEQNKQGIIQFFRDLKTAFPDLTMTADDVIAEGDKVFVRATMAGTHRGIFLGIPATGRSIEVPLADFLRVKNGRLVEHWGVMDTDTMMRQLGVVES